MTTLSDEEWMVIIPIVVIHLLTLIAAVCLPFNLSDSTNFWLNSTISQSVAALFGFIFAGYAFFRSEATLDDVDDSEADEILDRLHAKAHSRLINASIPAGIAIIGGLSTIVLTKEETIPVLGEVQRFVLVIGTFTFYQAVLAVIFSILFVIYLASPNRVHQVVEQILEEEEMTGRDVDVGEFIGEYIRLENMLRELYYASGGTNERASAGQMIDYLASEEMLDDIDLDELREITRYRNLVVHGEIESVDREAFNALQGIIEEVRELREKVQS